jgi:hypothetical protein
VANAGQAEARALLEYTFRRAAARLALSDDPDSDLERERKRLASIRALSPEIDIQSYENRLAAVVKAIHQEK